jgi:heme-degrading monooxygenase HmoA
MYARVTTFQGPPESTDDAIIVTREKALPQARQIPGFKGALSLVDRTTGRGLTITLWESEEALQTSEEAANQIRSDAVAAVTGGAVVSVDRYEVAIDER